MVAVPDTLTQAIYKSSSILKETNARIVISSLFVRYSYIVWEEFNGLCMTLYSEDSHVVVGSYICNTDSYIAFPVLPSM